MKSKKEIYLFPISGSVNEIKLASVQQNAKAYEAANIQARYYERSSFPNDNILLSDINLMLKNLDEIKHYIGIRSLDQVIDELLYREELNDVKLQEDILISTPAQTPKAPRPVPEKKEVVLQREGILEILKLLRKL